MENKKTFGRSWLEGRILSYHPGRSLNGRDYSSRCKFTIGIVFVKLIFRIFYPIGFEPLYGRSLFDVEKIAF